MGQRNSIVIVGDC